MMAVSKLSAALVSFSSLRSSPAQKLSPAPSMTTPCTSDGIVEKNVCKPSTSSSLRALRFSGRFSRNSAIFPRRTTRTHSGNATGQVLLSPFIDIPKSLVGCALRLARLADALQLDDFDEILVAPHHPVGNRLLVRNLLGSRNETRLHFSGETRLA